MVAVSFVSTKHLTLTPGSTKPRPTEPPPLSQKKRVPSKIEAPVGCGIGNGRADCLSVQNFSLCRTRRLPAHGETLGKKGQELTFPPTIMEVDGEVPQKTK